MSRASTHFNPADFIALAEETDGEAEDLEEPEAPAVGDDPGAERRYRFRHPTASGKTIAAAGSRTGRWCSPARCLAARFCPM